MSTRERPTHQVVVTSKANPRDRSIVGVAWQSDWGFSMVLKAGIVLDWRMCETHFISIRPTWENREARATGATPKPENGMKREEASSDEPEDIPF